MEAKVNCPFAVIQAIAGRLDLPFLLIREKIGDQCAERIFESLVFGKKVKIAIGDHEVVLIPKKKGDLFAFKCQVNLV